MSARPKKPKIKQQAENLNKPIQLTIPKLIPKTDGQKLFLLSMIENRITFCDGPAGCGKTYLAIGYALQLLSNNEIDRIVITRPMVPVSNKEIGFLPGTMLEKIWPYILPILDEAGNFIDQKELHNMIYDKNKTLFPKIEICPISFVRGRTFKNCMIIIDEAQSTNKTELIALLTRIGSNSKMVIQGDSFQSDNNNCDFKKIGKKLSEIQEINYVEMNNQDIVRDPLIEKILNKLND